MVAILQSVGVRGIVAALAFAAAASTQTEPAKAPPPAAAKGDEAEVAALLDRWQKEMSGLQSFTCKFRQEKRVSFMRRPLVSSGSLKYRDRKLLWVTDAPSASFLSFDGKEARIYHPEFNTLEIYALGGAAGGAPGGSSPSNLMKGGFPGFTGDFEGMRRQYSVEVLPVEGGIKDHRLRFAPKDEALKKEVVSIEFLLDEALLIKEWKLVRTNGDELKLAIQDFERNAKVGDADLTFAVPDGVKVVRMGADEKKKSEDGSK
jgi:outer membrane lipoprotein-sorting protein